MTSTISYRLIVPFPASTLFQFLTPFFMAASAIPHFKHTEMPYVLSAYWSEVQNSSIYYMHLNAVNIPSHITDGHPFLQGLETQAEVDWWLAILASRNSWKATIQCHGQL